jgi:hypothetical protein
LKYERESKQVDGSQEIKKARKCNLDYSQPRKKVPRRAKSLRQFETLIRFLRFLFVYLILWKNVSLFSLLLLAHNYEIEMTFELRVLGRKCSEKNGKEKGIAGAVGKVAKRKLFITFIRYQNVNKSMIKWPCGDIRRDNGAGDELFLRSGR